jgi:hypothetical protein
MPDYNNMGYKFWELIKVEPKPISDKRLIELAREIGDVDIDYKYGILKFVFSDKSGLKFDMSVYGHA